jgi:hypothetical protein
VDELSSMKYIKFGSIQKEIFQLNNKGSHFIVGIIIKKSDILKSKRNESYIRISISDLVHKASDFYCKDSFYRSIKVLLFGSSYKKLITEEAGTVIILINPKMIGTDFGPILSVDSESKVYCAGKSKDFGICAAFNFFTKEQCGNCVNLSLEKTCKQHQQEVVSKIKSDRPGLRSDLLIKKPRTFDDSEYNPPQKTPNASTKYDAQKAEKKIDDDKTKLSHYFDRRKYGKISDCLIDAGEESTIDFKALIKRKSDHVNLDTKQPKLA